MGYVGREVDSIIRDLMDMSLKMTREQAMEKVKTKSEDMAEEIVLDTLLPPARGEPVNDDSAARQKFRKLLREGKLNDKEIEIEISNSSIGVEIMAPPGWKK